jgi:hypothetical protein
MAKSGTPFENEVRKKIEDEIKKGRHGIDPKFVRLHQKKPYPSMRRDDIITDVSVELWRLKAADYWFLWIIECKDLGGPVPVDDVEEFHSKMQQINAHKGTIASRHGFQKGCVQFAESAKIGLFRLDASGSTLVLNENFATPTVAEALETHHPNGMPGTFAGITHGAGTFAFEEFLDVDLSEIGLMLDGK